MIKSDEYCGKLTGYKHHLQKKEKACDPCLAANREAAHRFRKNNPDKVKLYSSITRSRAAEKDPLIVRRRNLKRDFNLDLEEYDKMHNEQNGLCLICKQPETSVQRGKVIPLSVDHCHDSGKIRGLLCRSCNTGLGAFSDNIDRIKKAIMYLEEHKND